MMDLDLKESTVSDRICMDCGHSGCEWASVNNAVYLCLVCSGRHRSLGTHISFVRSTTLDMWNSSQLRLMELGGNARFLEMLEKFKISGLGFPERYTSRAAQWYRNVLEAERNKTDLPPQPSLEEAAQSFVFTKVTQPQAPTSFGSNLPNTKKNNWFSSTITKVYNWGEKTKEKIKNSKFTRKIKNTANSFYKRSDHPSAREDISQRNPEAYGNFNAPDSRIAVKTGQSDYK